MIANKNTTGSQMENRLYENFMTQQDTDKAILPSERKDVPAFENKTENTPKNGEIARDQELDAQSGQQPLNIFPEEFSMFAGSAEKPNAIEIPEIFGDAAVEVTYTPKHIADALMVTRQTVRNYADYFAEFITEERGQRGQRFFSEQDAKLLIFIISTSMEKGYTKDEMKRILLTHENPRKVSERTAIPPSSVPTQIQPKHNALSPAFKSPSSLNSETIEKLSNAFSEKLSEKLAKELRTMQEEITKQIEKSLEPTNELKETIQKQNAFIKQQADEIENLKTALNTLTKHS